MNLELKRMLRLDDRALGQLIIDGKLFCFTLEDKDRGLHSKMDLNEINKLKVYGKTAIPTGEYDLIINRSNRFSKLAGKDVFLPLLLNVRGYEGVRIHAGNKPEHTEGCILLGRHIRNNELTNSREAMARFMELIKNEKNLKIKIS